ncbi:Glycosyl transferases group 1 [Aromatoleum tolulyticum]|uniref:Glycosyl transferases group 1 n=2 Tax=Aromatoleum tolulyticum TaxID=34027 RepID=A0A1N6ZP49_9RHOO|nr:Glycosyl transferases group 1 [Aromatoleum tolulyticum]
MPELPRDRPPADGPWRVLFVGRLVEQKGVDILLEAARCLQEARHDFVMQIVGDGPLRHALQERVESMALTNCVTFLGPKAPETVGDAFLHADIFVLPSRYEGMPGVLLQALAYGVPVIATRVSGSEDVVSDDVGWLVRGDDAAALTAAFEQAFRIGREGLRAMGALGRELAERTYDMKLIAQSYEALFEELIGEQPKVAR